MHKQISIVHASQGNVVAQGRCVFSKKDYKTAEFPLEAYHKYCAGAYIQDALEMLSADDREFILSGIAPETFQAMFPAETEAEKQAENDRIEHEKFCAKMSNNFWF